MLVWCLTSTVHSLEFDFYSTETTVNVRLLLIVKTIGSVTAVYSFDFLMLTVTIVPVTIGKMENVCGLWLLLVQWKKVIIMICFSKNHGKCLVYNVNFCRLSLWFVRTVVKGKIYTI